MVKMGSPFGNLRVKGCSHLTAAYRSVPRPSSPVYAKASTNCPYLTLENPHHHRQACLHYTGADLSVVWFERPNNEDARDPTRTRRPFGSLS